MYIYIQQHSCSKVYTSGWKQPNSAWVYYIELGMDYSSDVPPPLYGRALHYIGGGEGAGSVPICCLLPICCLRVL